MYVFLKLADNNISVVVVSLWNERNTKNTEIQNVLFETGMSKLNETLSIITRSMVCLKFQKTQKPMFELFGDQNSLHTCVIVGSGHINCILT